jgi:hypothetical protein
VELERGRRSGAPDREDERPRADVPVGALEDPRLALQPEAVGLLDVLVARREHVEDEPAARLEQRRRGGERTELLPLVDHVEEGAERDRDERNTLAHGRLAQVTPAQVDTLRHALALGVRPRDGEHLLRLVHADHRDTGLRDGHCDAPRADGQLDDGAPRREGLVHVEAHVLGHRARPGVVDRGDPVVERVRAHDGFRAT